LLTRVHLEIKNPGAMLLTMWRGCACAEGVSCTRCARYLFDLHAPSLGWDELLHTPALVGLKRQLIQKWKFSGKKKYYGCYGGVLHSLEEKKKIYSVFLN